MSAATQTDSQSKIINFKQILVATDFSATSQRAVDYAAAMARHFNARIAVVHAIPPDPWEPIPIYPLPLELDRDRLDAEQQFKRLEDKISDLNHELVLEQGAVWDVLAAAIERESIDLLVLGTRGRGGLKKLVLGPVAEEVLCRAQCPVLTIGPNIPFAGAIDFKRILFATDFGPTSEEAWPYALSLAEDYGAKLVLLHMVPPMPAPDLGSTVYGPGPFLEDTLVKWQKTLRDESAKRLRALLPPNSTMAIEAEYVVGMDFLPEGILDVAAAHKIELIVMGANQTRFPQVAAHIPLSLTHEVICYAKCPVLTVCNAVVVGRRRERVTSRQRHS